MLVSSTTSTEDTAEDKATTATAVVDYFDYDG